MDWLKPLASKGRSILAMYFLRQVLVTRILLSFFLLGGSLIAVQQQDPTTSTLSWRGCGITKNAFMEKCAQVYTEKTGTNIRLAGGGATLGIEDAGQGGADFGGSCRACLTSRKEDQLPLSMTVVAWDALVVLLHPDNPLDSISPAELKAVLQQKITNWSELGGRSGGITTIARKGISSGVGYMTRLLIFDDVDYGKQGIRLQSSGPVEELLEETPNGIAVTGVTSARLRDLKILKIDGIEPTLENISIGKYIYHRPLYLAHSNKLNAEQRRFLDWLWGAEGQEVIRQQGTVNLEDGVSLAFKYLHWNKSIRVTNLPDLIEKAKQLIPKRNEALLNNGFSK